MDSLRTVLEQLEDAKLAYVFERSKTTSIGQALRAAGVPKSTFYNWPKEEQEQLERLAQELKRNRLLAAELVLIENAQKAAQVLADHTNVTLEDFVSLGEDGIPILDLRKAAEAGKLHLIKKLNYDKDGNLRGVELHDAQHAAMDVLDRTAGKPQQKIDMTTAGQPLSIALTWGDSNGNGNGNSDSKAIPTPEAA